MSFNGGGYCDDCKIDKFCNKTLDFFQAVIFIVPFRLFNKESYYQCKCILVMCQRNSIVG